MNHYALALLFGSLGALVFIIVFWVTARWWAARHFTLSGCTSKHVVTLEAAGSSLEAEVVQAILEELPPDYWPVYVEELERRSIIRLMAQMVISQVRGAYAWETGNQLQGCLESSNAEKRLDQIMFHLVRRCEGASDWGLDPGGQGK